MMNFTIIRDNKKLSWWLFVSIFSLVYWLLADVAEFCDQPVDSFTDTLYILAYFGVIAVMQAAFIGLITLNKYVFAVISPLLLCLGTVLTYFFITLHTTLTPTVVGLAFTNDIATSSDLITWPLILAILGAILVSAVFIYLRFRYVVDPTHRCAAISGVSCAAFLMVMFMVGKINTVTSQRQPFIIYSSVKGYFALRHNIAEVRHTFDNIDSKASNDTITVVLVLGESLRSDHLSINGYERNTTPLLGEVTNLVSYPQMRVSTYHTAISIPMIMTRADDEHSDIGYEEQSFITLFKKAGFKTYWIANQEPLQSFVYFVGEADSVINKYFGHSHYNYDSWLDEDLLGDYRTILNNDASKRLIVLHTIGSHWWYNTHYTNRFAKYKPELKSRNINANTIEQFVNSYDNCALYTDWFLSEVIKPLTDQNAVMIYISDHGEGLGEGGVLLHGTPSEGSEKAALIFWISDTYKNNNHEMSSHIIANKDNPVSNDILFHTILDCGGVITTACDTLKSVARAR